MFDYDRLSLDVAQQFANQHPKTANEPNNDKEKRNLSNGSSESQLFDWESHSPPAQEENCIVNGLSELLRRCSSPGQQKFMHNQNKYAAGDGGQFQRHRSATISNEQIYSAMISPNQQMAPRHKTIGNAFSMDLNQQQARRFSGGSMGFPEMFDCGASSGYGSPGAIGTPMASPAAVQHLANQLQQFVMDQGYCEGMPVAAMNGTPKKASKPLITSVLRPHSPQSGLSTPSATAAIQIPVAPGVPPVLVKATTTTTGTNKNSNKRKTSIANGASPGPENIVATEDGFDVSEIAEFASLLSSPKKVPPPRYICHICYQPGHYISDCPQRFASPLEELTPYQGRKKCYGEFQCEQCKRKWTSQNSVANEAQSCIKCHVPVFPHKQLPVDKAIALGLVKLQRLPVSNVSTPPTPMASGQKQPASLSPQTVRNAVEEAAASIIFGMKNGSFGGGASTMVI